MHAHAVQFWIGSPFLTISIVKEIEEKTKPESFQMLKQLIKTEN